MLMDEKINILRALCGHGFANGLLLLTSLTHSSYIHENPTHPVPSNERMEFLGDAVLQLLVTQELYALHPHMAEGQLSKLRSHVVNAGTLSKLAREMGLQHYLLLGRGEAGGDQMRDTLLADALEALLGAIYVDSGLDAARVAWERWHQHEDLYDPRHLDEFDAKSRLQEHCLKSWQLLPVYDAQEGRRGKEAWFYVTLTINQRPVLSTDGPSKRKAELWLAQTCLRFDLHRLGA
jgi:ribonuclease-3